MVHAVDIDNGLYMMATLIDKLYDPETVGRGVWYTHAKQQDLLLKLIHSLGMMSDEQSEKLTNQTFRLRGWEIDGGVRTDDNGRFAS